MRMNSGIILSGQQPDIIGTVARGHAAGRQNALAGLYQEHGEGIANGDPNAINALAAFDPKQAMAVKQGQQQMAQSDQRMKWDAEKMNMIRAKAARDAQQQAAGMDEAQRKKTAEALQGALRGAAHFYKSGDQQGYDAWIAQKGLDPAQVPFEAFPAHAAAVLGTLDVLSGPSNKDRYKTVGGQLVDLDADDGPAPVPGIDGRSQGTTIYDQETGRPIATIGGVGEPPKMTVDASKNTGFLIRLLDSAEILNELETQGTSFTQQKLDSVPLGVGNYFRGEDFQKFDQARRDFVNAILRRESGAVISDQEFDNAEKQYFPVPGDGPEVIAQKRKNRENAIAGVRAGAGPGAAYADRLDAEPSQPLSIDELILKYGTSGQ